MASPIPPLQLPRRRPPYGPYLDTGMIRAAQASASLRNPPPVMTMPRGSNAPGQFFRAFSTLNPNQITDLRHNPMFRRFLVQAQQQAPLGAMQQRAYNDFAVAWLRAHPVPGGPPPFGIPLNPDYYRRLPHLPHPPWWHPYPPR